MKAKLLIFFLRCLSVLPLSVIRKVGSWMGLCCWLLSTRMAKNTRVNLALCFPELSNNEQELLGKNSIQETFKTIVEMGPAWLWSAEKISQAVIEVEGLEVLQAAYAKKQGIIIIGPHLGNWEWVGPYLNACDCGPFNVMYQVPKEPAMHELIYSARIRNGMKLATTDTRGVAKILAALRRGEMAGILPDQVPPLSGGEFAKFFGVDTLTMTLLPRLVKKTGARVVLAYAKRVITSEGAGFKMIFRAADDNIYAEHMQKALQGMNDTVEAAVRESCDQYQWEYKRFKRQPEGKESVY